MFCGTWGKQQIPPLRFAPVGMTTKKQLAVRPSEYFGEVHGAGVGVLSDLFAAAEAVADDDGVGVVADGGE